ncbi:hypothetical protein BDV26DRAFT_298613 [Aspergillus bertholletiae]|uniref:NAD(P)-binding domain-containing protein n=1 Tax=Aspergillus bertholletiae TaxID=1226010 RepID=A0A5N7APL9_9EURO|nr:hypothetical protein BDV26DRAFT_298613 [Aspergillus bertholletiae]
MLEDTHNDRVEVTIHDFKGYPLALQERLRGANGCVWALGISQTAVPREEYIHITKEIDLEAAQAFQHLREGASDGFNFVYVSGEGATSTPGPCTPLFGRIKGETEARLIDIQSQASNLRLLMVRPAHVDSKGHAAIAPYIPQPTVSLHAANVVLGPVLRSFLTSYNSPTAPLGELLAGLATGTWQDRLSGPGVENRGRTTIISNVGFRRLMGLS